VGALVTRDDELAEVTRQRNEQTVVIAEITATNTALWALYQDALIEIGRLRSEYQPRADWPQPASPPELAGIEPPAFRAVAMAKIVELKMDLVLAQRRADAAELRAVEADARLRAGVAEQEQKVATMRACLGRAIPALGQLRRSLHTEDIDADLLARVDAILDDWTCQAAGEYVAALEREQNSEKKRADHWTAVALAFRDATTQAAIDARDGEHDPYLERAQNLYNATARDFGPVAEYNRFYCTACDGTGYVEEDGCCTTCGGDTWGVFDPDAIAAVDARKAGR
jgi:hypothetical protein